MLLADVPGDFPAEPPAVRTSAYFSACCKRINGVGPHSRAVRNGGNEYFVTIIAKGIVSFIIFGGYIQATHEFDIIGKVRGMTRKGK